MDDHLPDELDPPQSGPVVVVMVNRQGRAWPLAQPANARQLVARLLGLVVDRGPRRSVVERVAHRQNAWASGVIDEAEVADALLLEKPTSPLGELL